MMLFSDDSFESIRDKISQINYLLEEINQQSSDKYKVQYTFTATIFDGNQTFLNNSENLEYKPENTHILSSIVKNARFVENQMSFGDMYQRGYMNIGIYNGKSTPELPFLRRGHYVSIHGYTKGENGMEAEVTSGHPDFDVKTIPLKSIIKNRYTGNIITKINSN